MLDIRQLEFLVLALVAGWFILLALIGSLTYLFLLFYNDYNAHCKTSITNEIPESEKTTCKKFLIP